METQKHVQTLVELEVYDQISVLTRDGYCTREIKLRIAIAKEAFNRKISPLTSKLNNELGKKLIKCLEHLLYMAQKPRH